MLNSISILDDGPSFSVFTDEEPEQDDSKKGKTVNEKTILITKDEMNIKYESDR